MRKNTKLTFHIPIGKNYKYHINNANKALYMEKNIEITFFSLVI